MMLRPIQEEEEEGKFAQRRAKALGADMKTIAKGEADKVAQRVIEEHLAKSSVGRGLRLGSLRKQRAAEAGDESVHVDRRDVEAAALADLVIQQHTNLKRVELNLITKAQTRAAIKASLDVEKAIKGKWKPNEAKYRGKAFGFLAVDNPIRWSAIYICSNGLDELVMMIVYWYLFSNHYTRECIHIGETKKRASLLFRVPGPCISPLLMVSACIACTPPYLLTLLGFLPSGVDHAATFYCTPVGPSMHSQVQADLSCPWSNLLVPP